MVSVLDRKLLREVRGSLAMLLAITSIIAVGTMCFVYMRASYHNLTLAKWRYYCAMPDGRLLGRNEKGAAGRAGSAR